VDFRLLGTLEVAGPEGPLRLGGRQQRTVLAVLLLHANEFVSRDRLIDDLWGESPPRNARAAIHNNVSRLRGLLGADTIETMSEGYALRVDEDRVDARRFEHALETSRGLPVAERSSLLREALSLWRGQALAEFTFEPFAQVEIARLEELRLAALEDRIEAELERGLHLQLSAEIEALAASHPSRERLRELQMLALYRSGRQTDALEVYQDARLALIEELGLEPGERLRALERMILEHDPRLDLEGPPGVAADLPLAGEGRRTVTVVLMGVAEGGLLDPEAARAHIDRVVAVATPIVERFGGSVRQLLGEELVAVFGVGQAHEDDALRALRAACELRLELGADGPIRIGVEAGEMLVGGGAAAGLTGAPLAAARRLETLATPGEILLGPGALGLAAGAVEVVSTEAGAYRLLSVIAGAPAVARRLGQPLAGRRDELARLHASLEDAIEASTCRHLAVVGEAGIGKTRLCAAFTSSLGDRVHVLRGDCVPYGEGATYLPLLDAFRDLLGPGDVRAAIERRLAGVDDRALIAERLAGAIAADGDTPVAASEVSWAARRFLESLAGERPLVLCLEDAHWAETTLLDLVEYVSAWSTGAPLLLLTLSRPELLEARPGWGGITLTLEPLALADSRSLVQALVEQDTLDEDELSAVLRTAEGNPLFLEQLTVFAAERGLDAAAVPPTLDALLTSRLDRLEPVEQLVLGRASVVGADFTRAAVEELISGSERDETAAALLSLVGKRLLQPERSQPGQAGFGFRHALVRDVAYAGLPRGLRANLHERLARWLDKQADALDEIVGFHLEQAYRNGSTVGEGNSLLAREAGSRLGDAGSRAVRRADYTAAIGLLSRAASLLPELDPSRLELLCELGLSHKILGAMPKAERVFEEIIGLARTMADRRLELRALVELVWPRMLRGETDAAEVLELLDDAVAVFEERTDELGLARAWQLIAGVRGPFQGHRGESGDAARRALVQYRTSGFPARGCLMIIGAAAYYGPQPAADAIERLEELLSDPTTDRGSSADLMTVLAGLEGMRGRFSRARDLLGASHQLHLELGERSLLPTDWTYVAVTVERLAGNLEVAEAALLDACQILEERGDRVWQATHKALLALTLHAQDRTGEADQLATRARELAPLNDVTAQSLWRRAQAQVLSASGRHEDAEHALRGALGVLGDTDEVNAKAEVLLDLAEVLRAADRDYAPVLGESIDLFDSKGNSVLAGKARELLGDATAHPL